MIGLEVEFVEFDDDERTIRGHDPVVEAFTATLRANPGRWAKYPKPLSMNSASPMARRINQALSPAFADGTFEARTRRGELFVRHTGGKP